MNSRTKDLVRSVIADAGPSWSLAVTTRAMVWLPKWRTGVECKLRVVCRGENRGVVRETTNWRSVVYV